MQKIVVLDSHPYKKEDFSFLSQYGNYELFDQTTPSELPLRIKDANIILTNKTELTEQDLQDATHVKYIGVLATGFNVVDVKAAAKYGKTVTNIPTYGTNSVAQHTFALILELTNRVAKSSSLVKQDDWATSQRWCILDKPLEELSGKTLGIIGFGLIGEKVAKIAMAFGMKIIVHSKLKPDNSQFSYVPLPELLEKSDIISLHCPLTAETERMINTKTLALMRSSALIINASRGALIDEAALYLALKNKQIGGAALDVLTQEPPNKNHSFNSLDNCVVTPHVAWSGSTAMASILSITEENLQAFINGKPQNVVS